MTREATQETNGIVHIGPGAFHRAHQVVYTQNATGQDGNAWTIIGVSLRSTETVDALNAQNGRYTLVTRGEDGTRFRVIDAISGGVTAAHGPAPVIAALAAPETRIISLTTTEKAYQRVENPDPTNLIRILSDGLKMRRSTGLAGVTLLSCDNLPNNGAVLRKAVLGYARSQDTALADWIAENCRFPATMVDRITPAATPALLDMVAEQTGWADKIPVETEPFSMWVIEDDFAQGRPAWDTAGAILVSDVAPYEDMKLRMLNGAHSMLAYAGHLAGMTYVRDVMADAVLSKAVANHMDAAMATLDPIEGVDFANYRDALLSRFRNPHLAHETYQIAMDGSQKMPQRIFAPAVDAKAREQDLQPFAKATALWARYLDGVTDAGTRYDLRDPRADELNHLPSDPTARVKALFGLPHLVPASLADDPDFQSLTTAWLKAFAEHGVRDALKMDLAN